MVVFPLIKMPLFPRKKVWQRKRFCCYCLLSWSSTRPPNSSIDLVVRKNCPCQLCAHLCARVYILVWKGFIYWKGNWQLHRTMRHTVLMLCSCWWVQINASHAILHLQAILEMALLQVKQKLNRGHEEWASVVRKESVRQLDKCQKHRIECVSFTCESHSWPIDNCHWSAGNDAHTDDCLGC